MIKGIYSGVSALQAFQKKADASAHNTANINTDGYKKVKVSLHEAENNGVVAAARKIETEGPLVYEQTSAGSTLVEKSNVELSEEIPNMMIARRGVQANVKAIQAADEMLGSLLDIKG